MDDKKQKRFASKVLAAIARMQKELEGLKAITDGFLGQQSSRKPRRRLSGAEIMHRQGVLVRRGGKWIRRD